MWPNKAMSHQPSVVCTTTHQQVTLQLPSFTKTVPLLNGSNIALFRSSSGFNAALTAMKEFPQPVCFESHVIPNNDIEEKQHPEYHSLVTIPTINLSADCKPWPKEETSHQILLPAPSRSVQPATMPKQRESHGGPRERGSQGRYQPATRQETV